MLEQINDFAAFMAMVLSPFAVVYFAIALMVDINFVCAANERERRIWVRSGYGFMAIYALAIITACIA